MPRIEKIIAALPTAAKHPAATNKQAWDEYIDPDATTTFESVTEAERVVYIAAITVNECLLDGEMSELIRNVTNNTVTETWIAWVDGSKNEAVEFQVPTDWQLFDVAQAGADALGIDVCESLNVAKK